MLRGVSILLVLLFHLGLPVPGGFLGVDIFFVISGYLMAQIFARQLSNSETIDVTLFLRKRFSRIFPPMGAMIAAVAVVAIVLLSPAGPQQDTSRTGIGAVLGLGNLAAQAMVGGYFDIPAVKNLFLHLWSIGVELQFYVFLALIALILNRAKFAQKARRSLVKTLAAVGLLSLIIALTPLSIIPSAIPESAVGYFSPLPRLWEFAFGFLAFWTPTRILSRIENHGLAGGILGLSLILAMVFLNPGADYRPGAFALPAVLGATLILVSSPLRFFEQPGTLGKILLSLGKYSYSIYLWHWPLLGLAITSLGQSPLASTVALIFTLFFAGASYHLVETRFHWLPRERAGNWGSLVGLGLVLPLLSGGYLLFGASSSWWEPKVEKLQASVLSSHLGVAQKCDQMLRNSRELEECVFLGDADGKPILLVGDSHADQVSEGMLELAERENRPLHLLVSGGCPYLGADYVRLDKNKTWNLDCSKVNEARERQIEAVSGATVVVSISPHYFSESVILFQETGEASSHNDPLSVFERAINSKMTKWTESNNSVVLLGPLPRWDGAWEWDPTSCTLFEIKFSKCGKTAPLEQINAQATALNALYSLSADESNRILFFSLGEAICPQDICQVEADGVYLWRDASHLSIDGGRHAISRLFEKGNGSYYFP